MTELRRPSWTSVMPSGVQAGFASRGATYGSALHTACTAQSLKGPADTRPQLQEPALPWTDWPAPVRHGARGSPAPPGEEAAVSGRENPAGPAVETGELSFC